MNLRSLLAASVRVVAALALIGAALFALLLLQSQRSFARAAELCQNIAAPGSDRAAVLSGVSALPEVHVSTENEQLITVAVPGNYHCMLYFQGGHLQSARTYAVD